MRTPKTNSHKLTAVWHLTDTPYLTKDARPDQYFPNSEADPNPAHAGSSSNAHATLRLQWKLF
jgi:hypothetical protein